MNQGMGLQKMRLSIYAVLAAFVLLSAVAYADSEEVTEGQKRLTAAQTIKPLGPDLFGESTNFYNGVTTFNATDIDIPGNNALPVKLSRSFAGEATEYSLQTTHQAFGAWDLDVPYVYGVYATSNLWQVTGSAPNNRCSSSSPVPITVTGGWTGGQYWRGNFAHIPGSGNQSLGSSLTNFTATDGQTTVGVTPKYWQMRCGVQLVNGGANGFAGEGFILLSTDGTKYTFAQMSRRDISPITKTSAGPNGTQTNYLYRSEVRIYVTRVDDRFGNYVNYTWSGDQLTAIVASDGRSINLTYNSDGTVASAAAAGKTWYYSYPNSGSLTAALPDGTKWQYSMPGWGIAYGYASQPGGGYTAATCDSPASWRPATQTAGAHIVHPSGAVGDFTFLLTRHGRTNVSNGCPAPGDGGNPYGFKRYGPPIYTDSYALSSKQISGPGLVTSTWSASYAAPTGSDTDTASSGDPTTTTVSVTNPDTSVTRYTFGIKFNYNEGKLLRTETLAPNGTTLRDVQTTYALTPSNPPYKFDIGGYGDNFAEEFVTPATKTTISESGTTYTSTVNYFDNMARVLSSVRSGPTGSRTDSTAYYDNTNNWVLGQIQSQTNNDTGSVVSSITYDPATAKPIATYAYGLLQRSATYNGDGTIATVANGLTQTVTFSNWKRGAPQNITFPDSSTQSGFINDDGTVASTTDELGSTTNYGYDGAGRLATLTWPTADTVNWTPKTVSYAVLTSSELGVPVGSWRMRLVEGNHQKSVYYDAKLNPVLEEEKDTGLNLSRYVRHGYDSMGRTIFESYPSTSYLATAGINTTYDYLGRATQKKTTDGILLSTTVYLAGNQLQVTDAASNVTTSTFQAFDKPAYDKPLTISSPQGQTTTYSRNALGEVVTATRNGNNLTLTETNIYDGNHRLCKVIRPESGQHVVAFDAASQMTWSASGVGGSTSSCDYGSVPVSQQTAYGYDTRGRKTQITYPDSSGNVSMGYDAAGRLTSVANPIARWSYNWNKRGLLESQNLVIDGLSLTQDPVYDMLGHVVSETYPDGTSVTYSPNAWGEDTQVGNYATSIARHPTGAIQSAHFGNGLNFTTTLDARLRPASQVVSGASSLQSLSYGYNNNSQLTQVTDNVDGSDTASFGYDGLHRLTTANGLWGNYGYDYDPLGNIRNRTGTNALVYNYDGTNRLTNITGNTARSYSYDPRGRVISDGRFGFNWNLADQITGEPNTATYAYDGNSNRAKVTLANGSVEYAFYDISGKLRYTRKNGAGTDYFDLDGRPFVELAPGGGGTTTGTTTGGGTTGKTTGGTCNDCGPPPGPPPDTSLVPGGGTGSEPSTSASRSVALNASTATASATTTNPAVTYLHADWLGSPRLATDANGNVVWREHFDPYGKKLNGVNEKRGYTGHAYDPETGLTYMLARYYDADVGRFMMTDPIGSKDDLNLYAYVHGDSPNSTDPTGTCSPKDDACDGSDIGGGGSAPERGDAEHPQQAPQTGTRIKATSGSSSGAGSVREFAMKQAALGQIGKITSLEGLARTAAYDATTTKDPGTYVDQLGLALSNTDRGSVGHPASGSVPRFGDSGFSPELQDGGNQVRHFAGALVAGAQLGDFIGRAANTGREIRQGEGPYRTPNFADIRLGNGAATLGSRIINGTVPLADVAGAIRSEFGAQ